MTTLVQAGIKGGNAHKHKWTDEERDIVRRDYDGTNVSARNIASRLGVTLCAVKGQVQSMGIARDKSRRWTPDDEERLAELITQYTPRTIAHRLHRSINSVVVKSKRLGCSRRAKDGWFTKKDVCELLGVDHKWLQRCIDSGKLKAEWNNPERKPCQKGMAYWRIKQLDLIKFIKRNAGDFQSRNVDLVMIVWLLSGGI